MNIFHYAAAAFMLVFCFSSCKPVKPTDPKFLFSERYMLEWSDFKGAPDPGLSFAAVTHSGFEMGLEERSENGKLVLFFKIPTYFDRTKSWVRDDHKTDNLLRHEQYHFLISELISRQIRGQVHRHLFTRDYEREFEAFLQHAQDSYHRLHDAYDSETEHSANRQRQDEWETAIREMLFLSQRYASDRFYVHTELPFTPDDVISAQGNRRLQKLFRW